MPTWPNPLSISFETIERSHEQVKEFHVYSQVSSFKVETIMCKRCPDVQRYYVLQ